MTDAHLLILIAGLLYGSGAFVALIEPRLGRPTSLAYLFPAAAGAVGLAAGVMVLQDPGPTIMSFAAPLPFVSFTLRLDGLSGLFLTLASLGATTSSLFASPYLRSGGVEDRGSLAFAYNVFLFALVGVFLADDIYTFLVLWEMMSLASFLLVLAGKPATEARPAAYSYFIMMHLATVLIIASFLLLYTRTGTWSFEGFRLFSAGLDPDTRAWVFLLAFAGFGMKAGVAPLHVWLPRAHPTAPSHVSALMSGVMITAGTYMLIRTAFEFAGPPLVEWGVLLVIAGSLGALLGALQALSANDIKKALAYSTVEHSGLIIMALGVSILLSSSSHAELASFVLGAALFHTANHMVFKSLMFLGAGCVVEAGHTRDLEEMGGLARRMPRMAAILIVGTGALAALPPLNGFVSEWTIFQGLLGLLSVNDGPVGAAVATAVAMVVALAGAFSVAGAVRLYGLTFLGKGRSGPASVAKEPSWRLAAPLLPLAFLCLALGLFSPVAFTTMVAIAAPITGAAVLSVPGQLLPGTLSTMPSIFPMGIAVLIAWGLLFALLPIAVLRRKRSVARTWTGSGESAPVRPSITAAAYAAAATQIFPTFFQRIEKVERAAEKERGRASLMHKAELGDPVEDAIYRPVPLILEGASRRVRWVQSGSIHQYMVYLIIAMMVAVGAMRWL
ncbi:MAG: hypothetical protein HY556_03410 [Euryarchaeota archaeon]|nr:hypothetical protein [Euryarchaeota archaeon]